MGLFTGSLSKALHSLELRLMALDGRVAKLSTALSTTAGAALLVKINELEAALLQLQQSNRKELGKLWKHATPQVDALRHYDIEATPTAAPYCPNHGTAQELGPNSQAAKCECGYCKEMRSRREQFRSATLPKSAIEAARLAKTNAGK